MSTLSRGTPDRRRTASRRAVLGLAAAGSAGLILGNSAAYGGETTGEAAAAGDPRPGSHHDVTALRPADLRPPGPSVQSHCGERVSAHSEVGDQPTYYEISARPASFSYEAVFYGRMETWLRFFFANTPIPWARPGQIWSYGAYVARNDDCKSFHNYGRAFDIARIFATDPANGALHQVFTARYDQWRNLTGAELELTRRRYWATSASLHYHFRSVLTYFYNADHANHIHFDNGISGAGDSAFTTGSNAQVQHVQACVVYVWGGSLVIDGIWGPRTAAAVGAVLARIGRSGSLTNQANWLAFNRATLRFGSGAQNY